MQGVDLNRVQVQPPYLIARLDDLPNIHTRKNPATEFDPRGRLLSAGILDPSAQESLALM